jgi:hypothetical protein
MRLRYLLIIAVLSSCKKDVGYDIVPTPNPQVAVAKTNDTTYSIVSNFQIIRRDVPVPLSESANGTVYYNDNIIIAPGSQEYLSPIHLVKKNNVWSVESDTYGKIIDRTRNTYKVDSTTVIWVNGGTEDANNPTGNLYVSKTNHDNTLTWKKISPTNKPDFYHYAATGDIDGDGISDIVSYEGVETESSELTNLYLGTNYDNIKNTFPTSVEFETALGYTSADKKRVGAGFSFGSIAIGNVDTRTPQNELILTSTKVIMNEYYSFIILNYNKTTRKFEITSVVKPGGALKDNRMAVGDVRVGDFNGDKISDIVVSMGDYNDNSGVQVWLSNGNGNLVASDKKKAFYGKTYGTVLFYSNIEVGKFRGNDCVFLHFEGSRYTPRPQTNLDLNPFLLISNGDNEGFTHLTNIPTQTKAPSYVKGYFENNALRLIGIRGVNTTEFEITDIMIK